MKVAINAGHCIGRDPGACGSQITEAELNVKYAEAVCNYLSAAWVETVYIHENELGDICDIANSENCDLFVSIHCNSASSAQATGTETFYANGSSNGEVLADCIQTQLVEAINLPDRGLKTNRLYVTANTDMPACLVEVGFISNPGEEQIMIDKADDIARAIARGITDAINKIFSSGGNSAPQSAPVEENVSDPGKISKYFSASEVACHHCGEVNISPVLLQLLDDMREAIGGPLQVSSVYRCPAHNAAVGGVPNSQHVQGTAADCLIPYGWTVDQLADLAVELNADGVGRYYYQEFVHVDVRDGRVGAGYYWDDL